VKIRSFTGALHDDGPGRSVGDAFTYPTFSALRDEVRGLAEVFGYLPLHGITVRAQREAFVADGMMVSDNYLSALGTHAQIGRLLTTEDDLDGAAPAAVISHALWESEFGLASDVLGRPLLVNGRAFTIAGVLPPGFDGVRPSDQAAFYVPMSATRLMPEWPKPSDETWWVQAMARTRSSTTDAQLQTAMDVVFARLAGSAMQEPAMLIENGRAGSAYDRGNYRKPLLLLLGAAGVVILVACANLAGLSLARAAARENEFAVRAALGAGRHRIVGQCLTESILLALAGASLGLVFAFWVRAAIARLISGSIEGLRYDISFDSAVLGFTFAAAGVTALLFGLVPALRAGRVDPQSGLRGRTTLGAPRLRLGRILVAAQVALSLILLVGAGLYGRTLINLASIDPGFDVENMVLFRLRPRNAGYEGEVATAYLTQVQESLRQVPGVRSAAVSQFSLLGGWMAGGGFFTLPGLPTTGDAQPRAHRLTVSETFLETLRMPILRGRGLLATDDATAPKVVLINEVFARRYLADAVPLGRALTIGGEQWQIVGVVSDAKYTNIKNEVPPTVYFSFRQDPIDSTYFAVRTALPAASIVPSVRRAVAAIDPNIPMFDVKTQRQQFDANISQERLFAILCGALAGLALLLCCVGLFGLMAFQVARRTAEIGVRVALGAQHRDITRPILREALLLCVAGAAVAIPATLAVTRLIRSQLHGVEPHDPLALAAAVVLIGLVAVFAAWIPARRAAKVDPMTALRAE
jgi:predicted permease